MNDEIRIEIPEGMEIDKEKSNLEIGKIVFKKPDKQVKTWDDLFNKKIKVPKGCYIIDAVGHIEKTRGCHDFNFDSDKTIFINEKHAKMALAISQISQLMPFYGGIITDKEWNDDTINKYTICRKEDYASFVSSPHYEFLAFHTKKQRYEFFYNNEQLVNDYLMIAGQ